MSRHNPDIFVYLRGIDRAKSLCGIFKYNKDTAPAALDCTDVLRAALVIGMSSLDLLVHSIVKKEILYRYENKKPADRLVVPFNLFLADSFNVIALLGDHFSESHGYKSFIAPDKISEILSSFLKNPWSVISAEMGEHEDEIKRRLKELVRWRNRIAHEQDINPQLGGVALWPIFYDDVMGAMEFLGQLGPSIGAALSKSA